MEKIISIIEHLSETLAKKFRTQKVIIDDEVEFNGWFIRNDGDRNTTWDTNIYVKHIHSMEIGK